ncbi:MAG TPA: hypothetical protein VMP01_02255 [Pirellulaceae bacterium]|nr:hypothetical protein [Pirellulaceae bacterium]
MDLEAIEVADDQERRVIQPLAVLEELLVGRLQIPVLSLILPAEVPLHPYVRPALPAFGLADAPLEAVPSPLGVGRGGFFLYQQVAQVKKMLLARRAFGQVSGLPLGDELLGVTRCPGE